MFFSLVTVSTFIIVALSNQTTAYSDRPLPVARANKHAMRGSGNDHAKRNLAQSCLVGPQEISTKKVCNMVEVLLELEKKMANSNCAHNNATLELSLLLGTNADPFDTLQGLCNQAHETAETSYFSFDQIASNNTLFTKNFFDGGTYWNEERQTRTMNRLGKTINILKEDPGSRIKDVYDNIAQTKGITWPGNAENAQELGLVSNFDECHVRSAMCCWVMDRQANDGNGNCDEPYDENCVNADPADNTDICYADMSRSPTSNRVNTGYAVFPGEGEGDAHCHGFAWSADDLHPSNRFKGNVLFFVSMYDHLYQRGYVKNVPGAPMCGCTEKMPTVSRSDCTEVELVSESTTYKFDPTSGSRVAIEFTPQLKFNACTGLVENNDLLSHYDLMVQSKTATAAERAALGQILVGEGGCPNAIQTFTSNFKA